MNKITYDFNNMMANRIGAGKGVTEDDIQKIMPQVEAALGKMSAEYWPFMELTKNGEIVSNIKKLSGKIAKKCKTFVVIGIGGSALGNRTLYNALPPKKGGPELIVTDNVDPDTIAGLVKKIDFKKTIFNVITKSGDTAETMATFMVFKKHLIAKVGYKKHKENIIVTTDPQKGSLREIALKEGYTILEVPKRVGGRFSVLSNVGLLSAGVCGINIKELLAGALYMEKLCGNRDIWKNPGVLGAILQYLLYKKGRPISVLMPYSDRLKDLAEWFSQLWAESIGKNEDTGSTPVKALGVTDQHSQLQLYMEGPHDKVITFIRVEKFDAKVVIPKDFKEYKSVNYLGGRTINELINAEQKGTELALTKNNRPNATFTLNKITPFNMGALLNMFEVQTAFFGELCRIDAFNQPGVELSKQLTGALLGRPGYEEKKKDIEALPKWQEKYCVIG